MLDKAQLSFKDRFLFFFKPPLLILGGVTLLIITTAITIYFGDRSSVFSANETTMEKIPEKPTKVSALGRLEPAGEVITISASSSSNNSDRIAQILVEEGDKVQEGQILAILNSRNRLQAAVEEAKANVYSAQARLAQVKAGAKQGEIIAQKARFEQTKAELEGQIITQQATINSLEAQLNGEKAAQEATIERLKANLLDTQKNCERYQILYTEGAVSEQQQDKACLEAKTAEDSLREGEANLQRITTTGQENIREAQANLKRTKTTLNKQITENQATLNAVEEIRPVDVQVAQGDLMMAQAALKRAEADLELAYIKAPQSGEILKIHTKSGELIGNLGILELGQTNQMYAVGEVYETDITKIQVGQSATVISDALDEELQGTVEQIGRQVLRQNIFDTNPIADSDGRIVEVKIRLDDTANQKVSGLTNQRIRVTINLTSS